VSQPLTLQKLLDVRVDRKSESGPDLTCLGTDWNTEAIPVRLCSGIRLDMKRQVVMFTLTTVQQYM
jgi:hypothetical protein